MLNIYLIAFIVFTLILWRETPKGNEMATLDILTALVKGGMTPVGACAMGGNMMAESSMRSNNLQDSFQKKLGFNDEDYTIIADNRTYDREQFALDGAGYGLCQWTSPDRKGKLHDFAELAGCSIGDEAMQVKFCIAELKNDYPSLWSYLCAAQDISRAVLRVCKEYERPAVNNIDVRLNYAKRMYEDYGETLEKMQNAECRMQNDTGTVITGEHTPEAIFLAEKLKVLGYDVLWDGLTACVKDFQQRKGLTVDGICGKKTWKELIG